MSQELTLNNKEIVSRALDILTKRMQNLIITEMPFIHGQNWWRTVVVSQKIKLGIVRDLPDGEYIEPEEMTECMDTQLCCKLIRNDKKRFYPSGFDGDVNSMLSRVLDARNGRSHTGKMTYIASEARQTLEDLIEFDSAMDLGAGDDIRGLLDRIHDDPVFTTQSIPENPITNEVVEDTVTLCNEYPKKSYVNLPSVTVSACRGFYNALLEKQKEPNKKTSRNYADVSFNIRNGIYHLTLDKNTNRYFPVDDTTGVVIDGVEFGSECVSFERYDPVFKKVQMVPGPALKEALESCEKIQLFNDMKWLIKRTGSYFESFAKLISFPDKVIPFAGKSRLSQTYDDMTEEQSEAVKMALNEPLSYVWGVPGSGKTRYVLATAINECVIRGERVAVIAPTNNALEQVLGGLLDAFDADKKLKIDPHKDLVRIGTPTTEFIRKYPGVCEIKGAISIIREKKVEISRLKAALADRKYESFRPKIKDIKGMYNLAGKTSAGADKVRKAMDPLLSIVRDDPRFPYVLDRFDKQDIIQSSEDLFRLIYDGGRIENQDDDLRSMSDNTLNRRIEELTKDVQKMESENPKSDIDSCKVIAMTLSKYIMSFGPEFLDSRKKLNVDHVFVDEAGYCNCLQTLSLFALGVPVTLLGDHKQLPPVCELEKKTLVELMVDDENKYDYLWDLSALYVDGFFSETMNRMADLYRDSSEPSFQYTSVAKLRTTHRFGQNLADILGQSVYNMNIRSNSPDPLEIEIIDAHIDQFPEGYVRGIKKTIRKNVSEAKAVVKYVRDNKLGRNDFVILTPYNEQIKCIKQEGPEFEDNILTIHRSQGQERDTVIISICDGSACTEDKPPRFTSTKADGSQGQKVINTALSRAKKKLVVVCDITYWGSRPEEMLGQLIAACNGLS